MTCFYCGANLLQRGNGTKKNDPLRASKDHIYSASMIRKLTPEHRNGLPKAFWDLNLVDCCQKCNSYKGHLHPLDWIVIMPNAYNASRLAERLVAMGESMEEVFDAMRRRRHK